MICREFRRPTRRTRALDERSQHVLVSLRPQTDFPSAQNRPGRDDEDVARIDFGEVASNSFGAAAAMPEVNVGNEDATYPHGGQVRRASLMPDDSLVILFYIRPWSIIYMLI